MEGQTSYFIRSFWLLLGVQYIKISVHSIYSFLRYSQFQRPMTRLIMPIFDHVQQKHFWSTFNLCELVSACKKSGYFIDLFWRYGWLKKFCNLIGWEHFRPYLRDKTFPKYGICAGTQQIIQAFSIEQIQ